MRVFVSFKKLTGSVFNWHKNNATKQKDQSNKIMQLKRLSLSSYLYNNKYNLQFYMWNNITKIWGR